MKEDGIKIKQWPKLKKPMLIAGFDGWGNALKISSGMATYLVRKLKGQQFAAIDPDTYYRYDETRPLVRIEDGILHGMSPPAGAYYAAATASEANDVVILKADEPNLRWYQFIEEMFSLCRKLGVETIITLGSMYDNVLHTDRVISGIASTKTHIDELKAKNVNPISYQGPSAIHSIIQQEGPKNGFSCMSLWSHCPFYLQGTTHFGLLAHLGTLLASMGGFDLDIKDLEDSWQGLNEQIQELIKNNAEVKAIISELRKTKIRGSSENLRGSIRTDEKVIDIKDFLDPQ
jgi:proteasome assembly chaperone (PAC2) family protein